LPGAKFLLTIRLLKWLVARYEEPEGRDGNHATKVTGRASRTNLSRVRRGNISHRPLESNAKALLPPTRRLP